MRLLVSGEKWLEPYFRPPTTLGKRHMTDQRKKDDEQSGAKAAVSTSQLDRLEKLASAASVTAQARQWNARKSGLQDQPEPSEVRDLSQDANARAQAEEAMKRMMEKPGKKPSRRW
jgi:hypothetical protein